MTTFAQAIESALEDAMARDDRVVVFGEDVEMLRRNLLVRFGGDRVMNAPISESAFLGAAVGAAMGGLRPVAELMLVDFVGVALDTLLNHASKLELFSGGDWKAPLVVRAACGGGYGDGGQHEQCLWGLLGGIPGLAVVVPSNPADAAGLMLSAIEYDGPVVYLEHKLLSDYWLDYMGGAGRRGVDFDVPSAGAEGPVAEPPTLVPLGTAAIRRHGADVALISIGVAVHRCLAAADVLAGEGVQATVLDLRSVSPLDRRAIAAAATATGRIVAADEDYLSCGLSAEVGAVVAEQAPSARFARVATESVLPYARPLEDRVLPNVNRIVAAARSLLFDRRAPRQPRELFESL